MMIHLPHERVQELYTLHQRYPENTLILIWDGRWFEMTFRRHNSWYIVGGVRKESVEFTLYPLFRTG